MGHGSRWCEPTRVCSCPFTRQRPDALFTYLETAWQRYEERLRDALTADIYADGLGLRSTEERYDVTCDHCSGLWDGLFTTQEEADQWMVQHRAVCLTLPRPSFLGK